MKKYFFSGMILLLLLSCDPPQEVATLYLIGDSTMADKNLDKYPETGWGQVLPNFFTSQLVVKNHALNGRSSRSFIDEGRWNTVLDSLKKGDYVCIQFGHNDQKFKDSTRFTNPGTGYRKNLIRFIADTRERGATPILITSIVRRSFNEYGVLMDSHGLYPLIMHQVSKEYNVPMIDLQLLTEELVLSIGEENSKNLYNWLAPGEHENYPDGNEDNTHLNTEGALQVAALFVQEITKSDLKLKEYLK